MIRPQHNRRRAIGGAVGSHVGARGQLVQQPGDQVAGEVFLLAGGELLLAGDSELHRLGSHRQDHRAGAILVVPDPDALDAAVGELDPVDVVAPRDHGPELDVEYIVATEPDRRHHGKVKEIHGSAEVRGDEGNTVLIKVGGVEKAELPDLRPGATVTGKVYCGRRAVGYVWLHDFFAYIQSRIFFRWF